MSNEEKQERKEYTRQELQDILTGVKELSKEDLSKVFGGLGDEREEYTLDKKEIERDIFGSKMIR